jgi:hypothetical protein
MKVFRPGLKPMYVDEPEPAPVAKPAGPTQADLVKMAIAQANARAAAANLRQDGPTLEEYVAAGYDPKTYPPAGFAAVESKVAPPASKSLFGANPTELIPPVSPKPLVDNNLAPGDPAPMVPATEPPSTEPPQVDPLLK